jgi:hypothetical protein
VCQLKLIVPLRSRQDAHTFCRLTLGLRRITRCTRRPVEAAHQIATGQICRPPPHRYRSSSPHQPFEAMSHFPGVQFLDRPVTERGGLTYRNDIPNTHSVRCGGAGLCGSSCWQCAGNANYTARGHLISDGLGLQ